MDQLFRDYGLRQAGTGTWDEMFTPEGAPHPACANLLEGLLPLADHELESRAMALSRDFEEQGITFQVSGKEAPFPLDLLPRVISADEWRVVERGVVPRGKAPEAFLGAVYGIGRAHV